MSTTEFIEKLRRAPDQVAFQDTMDVIDQNFEYTPTAFQNGNVYSKAGDNEGSCKLFAFAKFFNLNQKETLHCFGNFYREVLENPNGENHQNIRNFMKTGWAEVEFEGEPLVLK